MPSILPSDLPQDNEKAFGFKAKPAVITLSAAFAAVGLAAFAGRDVMTLVVALLLAAGIVFMAAKFITGFFKTSAAISERIQTIENNYITSGDRAVYDVELKRVKKQRFIFWGNLFVLLGIAMCFTVALLPIGILFVLIATALYILAAAS